MKNIKLQVSHCSSAAASPVSNTVIYSQSSPVSGVKHHLWCPVESLFGCDEPFPWKLLPGQRAELSLRSEGPGCRAGVTVPSVTRIIL
ncbi:Deoxyguanosinetriphosphate triphosphohydrolase-like protein [Dissostichus eleginoides]|uniref:Deoxyguanosinetriphosphate triphosphohydrolase-like protein n=1 Tax=Dissostichus eleginoides TaxID=100907 RepID=A0AAD9C3Q4_DISEL|nr:Deoxyguanosinetriphosphate triphosphohydrolase-like protein [Dissostichus eleginoides]